MDYIEQLKEVIKNLHGVDAEYLETVPVTETFQGQTAWQGDVEVFKIRGHPIATRCYTWAHSAGADDRGKKYLAVLGLPPVDSL
jgi:hypothetical protein